MKSEQMTTTPPLFPHMFQPYALRGLTLKNRIAISGHFAHWWVDKGLPSDEFAAYIEERAKGGVGLFVIGATSPDRGSGWIENIDDRIIPCYRSLVEAGHRHGTAVFAQLCHPGFGPLPGRPVHGYTVSAAPTQPVYRGPERRILSVEELRRFVRLFGEAAGRAAEGGVDGVEVHSHEWFLHAQMLNPLYNTREDEYGGSLENRLRFLMESLQAMRASVGQEMPIGVRLKLDDMEQRGMGAPEYIEAVQILEASGLVDYINFSGGDGHLHHGPMARPEGEWLPLVRQMRSETRLTLMHTGRINTPEMAERALADNIADILCMTKTHICDPHFTRKVFENRLDDIRYCTRCLQSCHGKMHLMTCVYNPLTSREIAWSEMVPAGVKKRVVIVGAGPAGMEAAITAAQRGHDVIVLEKSERVGGQVWIGASSPMRKNWSRIAEFYERQARKGIFETRLNTEATTENILSQNPDVVIIATGSQPNRLQFEGGPAPFTVHEVLKGEVDMHDSVVIYDRENFMRPFVAADYLSDRGAKVWFVSPFLTIGDCMDSNMRDETLTRLTERRVEFLPGYELAGWEASGSTVRLVKSSHNLRLRSVQTAEELVLENIGAIVGTVGSAPDNELAASLRGLVPELHVIGDANIPQTVEAATYQGARVGRLV